MAFFFQLRREFAFSPLATKYPNTIIPAAKKRNPVRIKGGKPCSPKEIAKKVIPQIT